LDEPAKPHRSDPAFNLLDSALHDGAVIVEAYTRFTATVIGTVLFPYAAMRRPESASKAWDVRSPPQERYPAIANVIVALLIGIILGRRLFSRR
jgi:hypothetical protein